MFCTFAFALEFSYSFVCVCAWVQYEFLMIKRAVPLSYLFITYDWITWKILIGWFIKIKRKWILLQKIKTIVRKCLIYFLICYLKLYPTRKHNLTFTSLNMSQSHSSYHPPPNAATNTCTIILNLKSDLIFLMISWLFCFFSQSLRKISLLGFVMLYILIIGYSGQVFDLGYQTCNNYFR